MLSARRHFLNIDCFVVFLLTFSSPFAYSLSFNITSFSAETNNIAYEGDAGSFNGSIEFNTAISSLFQAGRAFYDKPRRLWDSSTGILTDFTTCFSFVIDTLNKSIYSDGFAFYLAPIGYQIPPNSAGGYLGLFNDTTRDGVPQNHVVSVEFDTYANDWDPPMQRINNNSIESDAYTQFDFARNSGNQGHALITYNAFTKSLSVSWSFNKSSTAFMSNASLSYQIDLMEVLPEWVTVGFSAAIGLSRERHTIQSWEFSSTLNSKDTDQQVTANRKKHRRNTVVIVVASSTCSFTLILVGVIVCWLIIKKKSNKVDRSTALEFDLDQAAIPRRFCYQELVAATNGFAEDRRLGRGGSGQVYKGICIDLGRFIAVKRIFANFENSERIFINEVKIISRLIHRNLVQFIGWCHERGEFLLVFEYMPNGGLDNHLFGNRKTLPWDVRYKAALGVATAVHYLHEDAEQCVLHRDIKSANVLLDSDFRTKLGDFGMAKLVDPRLRTQRTGVVGTYGYLAPEYINKGKASKESDIYGFGVVALEIASGRRIYQDGDDHIPLVNWVWQLYVEGNILNAADERLNGDFDEDEMTSLLTVGLWCTDPRDKERPRAAQVIKVLQLEAALPVLPRDMHDAPPRPTHKQSDSIQSQPITTSLGNVGR